MSASRPRAASALAPTQDCECRACMTKTDRTRASIRRLTARILSTPTASTRSTR